MLSVSTPGRYFFRPSRCLTCRLQGLGLARAPQRAFFNSPDNVALSVLRLVAEAGQPGPAYSLKTTPFKGFDTVSQNLIKSIHRFSRSGLM
jgi:hypothetical protein